SLGNGDFQKFATIATASTPVAVAIADFNGDGNQDLAVLSKGGKLVSIFLGDGAGGFGTRADYAVGNTPLAMVVADFNGDGILDIATANSADNTISILIGDGA